MNIKHLHDWNVTYADAITIQKDLSTRLILHDDGLPDMLSHIAGADISYAKGDNLFYAAVVVLDYRTMEIVEEVSWNGRVDFPYIPGLLSFREGPPLLRAFEKLRIVPDVVMFDGQGIAHPRGIGLASHVGLFLEVPAIGCAKTRLIGTNDPPGGNVGDSSCLLYQGKTIGAVVRTKKGIKPIFISQGHKIGLDSAISVVLSCTRGYKLPEPTRQAHLAVNRLRLHGPS